MRRVALLAVALLLVLVSLVPAPAWSALGMHATHRGGLEAVTLEALAELPWVLRAVAALLVLGSVLPWSRDTMPEARSAPAWQWILPLAVLALAVAVMRIFVLHGGMISGDEWNNAFTARLFAQGRVFDLPPPDPEAFRFTYFVTHGGRYFSIFPPLWPALLALGEKLGIGVWINLLLALAAALLAARWDKARGPWILWLLLLSPMFVFTAGSYFASLTVCALVLLLLWTVRRWIESARLAWALAAGLAAGALFAAHYPTAIGAGIPPMAWALWSERRRTGTLASLLAMKAGALAGLIALGAYHHAVHGGPPWLFPLALYDHSLLAIHPSLGLFARGLAFAALHGLRLLAWSFPLLPLLAFAGARRRAPHDALLVSAMAGLVAFYFFYPSAGGPQYGPRYWFGLLGPLAILGARGVAMLGESRGGRVFRGALVACALLLFALRVPLEERRSARINAPYELAQRAELKDAIVFLNNVNRSDTGRNEPGWNGPVLFVQEGGARDAALRALYPGRAAYRFGWTSGKAQLEPVSRDSVSGGAR
jgi:hypothetical protein